MSSTSPRGLRRVTLRDVRAVNDTVYECGELWYDPPAWQTHLMRRACAITGCRVGLYFEVADDRGRTADRILTADDVGWASPGERHTVLQGLARRPLRDSCLWAAFADRLSDRDRQGGLTARQDRIINHAEWHGSEMYDRHFRPTRLGDAVLSAVWLPHLRSWSVWSLIADRDDRTPSARAERVARLLHRRVAPMIGKSLSTWRDRTVAPLSATRLRILEALLNGDSEPDVAKRTCRSRSAIHEHVTAIYRHFGVRSRAKLAAFFLRRQPTAAGPSAETFSPDAWLNQPWPKAELGHGTTRLAI